MKRLLFILLVFPAVMSFSQTANVLSSSISLAQTSVADRQNYTAFHNPAALGYQANTEFAASFENRFFLSQLSTKTAQAAITSKIANFGFGFSHFGYSIYHEMLAGVAVARNFSDRFALGVAFNYFTSYFAEENRYRGALLLQAGVNVQVSEIFSLAFNTFNPFLNNIKTETVEKKILAIYSIGSAYNFTENLVWRTQIDREMNSNFRFATSFDYRFEKKFILKIGAYGFSYLVPCLGAGFGVDNFAFDLNCELHPLLGLNTMGSLKYKLK